MRCAINQPSILYELEKNQLSKIKECIDNKVRISKKRIDKSKLKLEIFKWFK